MHRRINRKDLGTLYTSVASFQERRKFQGTWMNSFLDNEIDIKFTKLPSRTCWICEALERKRVWTMSFYCHKSTGSISDSMANTDWLPCAIITSIEFGSLDGNIAQFCKLHSCMTGMTPQILLASRYEDNSSGKGWNLTTSYTWNSYVLHIEPTGHFPEEWPSANLCKFTQL